VAAILWAMYPYVTQLETRRQQVEADLRWLEHRRAAKEATRHRPRLIARIASRITRGRARRRYAEQSA
jgi:hypothetical protein